MYRRRVWSIGLVLLVATAALAQDIGCGAPVFTHPDVGLDDVVNLATALQRPA